MANETRPSADQSQPFEFDLGPTLQGLVRLLCLATGIVVLGIGIYCGWRVFEHVEAVVTEGKPLAAAVDRISQAIEAEKIAIRDPEKGIQMELGRSVAVGLLWMFYIVWAWVAMGFIKAGGSLISSAVSDRSRTTRDTAGKRTLAEAPPPS